MREPPVLAAHGLGKSFGAVRALQDVSLHLHAGEAHALAGENGAGKSTLIKILAGVHRPDAGIAVIYQEPTLFPELSVAENIFMGRQPRRSLRRVDHKAVAEALGRSQVRLLGEQLGYEGDIAILSAAQTPPTTCGKYVKNGTIAAFGLWDPAKLGALAAHTAVALSSGQITGRKGETLRAGDLGSFTLGDDGVVDLGRPTVFDKENVDRYRF